MTRPPVVSVDSACDKCSLPIIGRHGRLSSPTSFDASTMTVTGPASATAAPLTGEDSGPSTWTSESEETAYHLSTPGLQVVSTYGGCGTASTSRPAWSSGSKSPSGVDATCTW
jgi:hypothetical protein